MAYLDELFRNREKVHDLFQAAGGKAPLHLNALPKTSRTSVNGTIGSAGSMCRALTQLCPGRPGFAVERKAVFQREAPRA